MKPMGGAVITAPAAATAAVDMPRIWFTAAELADLLLPGLPADKRSVARRARDEAWHLRHDSNGNPLSRPRIGRGGGTEFNVALLPGAAQIELAARGIGAAGTAPDSSAKPDQAGAWRWFECQSAKVKAEAERRVAVIAEIDLMESAGMTRTAAIGEASGRHHVSQATLWNWLRLIEGLPASDRLPALAPRRQGGGAEREVDRFLWDLFKSDYLRASAPTLAICYAKCAEKAKEMGLSWPSEKTISRKFHREVSPQVILLARGGDEALRRSLPAQRRTVKHLHAMELVNIDGHKFDVFAELPDGTKFRPILIGIQDVFSRKMLAWRIGEEESAVLTRLAFADLFAKWGIPKGCYMDNGRAFASKWVTGGMLNRFRFKVKPEEPTGLITALGIHNHWTTPYRGQSKPIERAWRDMCDSISRSAAFDGAYTGSNTTKKPHNYGERVVPIAEFMAEVESGIAFHNARTGRKTEMARGRSFDAVFAESYASAPIGKATPEQLRMALLMGENRRVNKQTGELSLFGNRYWSLECGQLHGQLVTVRFDPDDLSKPVHLYDLAGRYLGDATRIDDTGFDDVAQSKQAARMVSDHRKATKVMLEAERRLSAAEVAEAQRGFVETQMPEPSVVRPMRHRGQTAAALKLLPEPMQPARPDHQSRVFASLLKVVE